MFELQFQLPPGFVELLPEEARAYGPALAAGLESFIAGLPDPRRAAVLGDLLALGPSAPVEEQLHAIAGRCPTLHKLGQILARDPRLPESLTGLLQQLESMPPRPVDPGLRAIIEEATGHMGAALEVEPMTLAEASVAAVVPFDWHRSASHTQHGVFKVHKPGAVEAIDHELDLWPGVGEVFAQRCTEAGLEAPNSADLFGRMREVLEREVDLVRERRNLRLARSRMESVEPIEVPAVLPFGSQHVLAMERLDGRALGDVLAAGEVGAGRGRRLADELFTALVLHPLLQPRGDAVLHGDPHAGNIMLLTDGRLGVLDWSLAAILSKRERVALVQTLLSGLMLDRPQLRESLIDMSEQVRDREALDAVVGEAVREVHRGRLPGIGWFVDLIDTLVVRGVVRFPPNLLVVRKSWLALAGVLLALDPEFSAERGLVDEIFGRSLRELPRRLVSLPFSRSFASHLSNYDLMRLVTSGPKVVRNFWSEVMAG